MICQKCGAQLADGSSFCPSCGTQQGAVATQTPAPMFPGQGQSAGLRCPRCGNTNVTVQREQVSGKTKTKHNGRGLLWRLMRLFLIICTCGLWLLVGKSKGKSKGKTKFESVSVAVCQNCGNSWQV